ncbi:universal stress protein [Cryobacterium fucosi]|uniref:Universal stress protein n=2 Tax=Cryobacterium fucosi TaxID=1259157 RepID=A0A4R9BFQ5_9MICO|nr:universal stress protein [Cryobacterium fucosi]
MERSPVMVERVVVAVDGGPASTAALDWALERAKVLPISLELTTVVDLGWAPAGGPDDDFRPIYERALSDATQRVEHEVPDIKKTSYVRRGVPADELVRASASADLLVIGTNKTGFLAGAVYGTLPLRLAAHSHCPVVVVPATWNPTAGTVVVGLEDDATAEVALSFAAAEATRLGRVLDIIHAWSIPATVAVEYGAVIPFDELRDAHAAILAEAAGRVRTAHPGLEVREVLEQGPAAMVLVDASGEAELVVVGTHGRGAVGSLFLGSVSHDVLLNLTCPVAVIPRPERLPDRVEP